LGTGNKCLNRLQLRKEGDVVNDSHAEIVMKRSFQRFLFEQILIANSENNKEESIFERIININNQNGNVLFKLKNDIRFHMYISQTPCGDAQIDSSKLNQSIQSNPEPNQIEKIEITKTVVNDSSTNDEPPIKKRKKNISELPPIDLQTGAGLLCKLIYLINYLCLLF